ncbi:MAG: hypothetical protein R6X17_02730, partial [Candidatus Competibacteraceae bacterium]
MTDHSMTAEQQPINAESTEPPARPHRARYGLLVLGMHRSGTSPLTRLISLLGADLPSRLMPPAKNNNETGFWESVDLWQLHDELLASIDMAWDSPLPLDEAWFDSSAAQGYRWRLLDYLRRDFADSDLFVIKDPRICRLFPLWRQVLADFQTQPGVVIPLRNPLEIAASLEARDEFVPAKSLLLWLRHMLDSERFTRDLPRFFVTYEQLLRDWRSVATHMADTLEIHWPRHIHHAQLEIDEFLSSGRRHHAESDESLQRQGWVADWVRQAYGALRLMADGRDDEAGRAMLDRIHRELIQADQTFAPVLADQQRSLEQRACVIKDQRATLADQSGRLDALQENLARRDQDLQATRDSLQAAALEAQRMQQRYQELQARHEQVQIQYEQARDLSERQSVEIRRLQHELHGFRRMAAPFEQVRETLRAVALPWFWRLTGQYSLRMAEQCTYALLKASGKFDESYYLLKNPDVLDSGDPLLHYIRHGAREGRNPNPDFDSAYYLEANPDVLAAGLNPLEHFVLHGEREDRPGRSRDRIYQLWIQQFDALDDGERERLRARMAGWKGRPLISVLLPVYDVEEDWLARAVESVRGQL